MFTQMLRVQELDAITQPVFIKGKQQRSFVVKAVSVTTGCAVSTKPVSDNHGGEAAEKMFGFKAPLSGQITVRTQQYSSCVHV